MHVSRRFLSCFLSVYQILVLTDMHIGGGWTATVIPEAHRTVETTAGTLMFIDVPKTRKDIWDKFNSKNFPAWSYRRGEGDE